MVNGSWLKFEAISNKNRRWDATYMELAGSARQQLSGWTSAQLTHFLHGNCSGSQPGVQGVAPGGPQAKHAYNIKLNGNAYKHVIVG